MTEDETQLKADLITGAYRLNDLSSYFGLNVHNFRRRVLTGAIMLKTFQLSPSRKAPYYVSRDVWEKFLKRRERGG